MDTFGPCEPDSVPLGAIRINAFPPELLANILARLNITDRCLAAQVCSTWWNILTIPQLWCHLEVHLQLDQPYHPTVLPSVVVRCVQKVIVLGDNPIGLPDLLRKMIHLRSLRLCCSQYLPDLIIRQAFAQQLDNITVLSLNPCAHLREETLAVIGLHLPQLFKLELSNCTCDCMDCTPSGITDRGIQALIGVNGKGKKQCQNLRFLTLNCCNELTDQSLLAVAELPKLSRLDLSGFLSSKVTDLGLNKVLTQTSLVTLNIEDSDIGNIFLAPLDGSMLVTLYISECKELSDLSLKRLSKLVHLRFLNLAGCDGYGDKGLFYLVDSKIVCLCLDTNDLVTDLGLGYLARMKTLRVLYLFACLQVGESGAALLAESKSIVSLFWFCRSELISETGFNQLAGMSSLRECTLSRCDCLEDIEQVTSSNAFACMPSLTTKENTYEKLCAAEMNSKRRHLVISTCRKEMETGEWLTRGWKVVVKSHWEESEDESL